MFVDSARDFKEMYYVVKPLMQSARDSLYMEKKLTQEDESPQLDDQGVQMTEQVTRFPLAWSSEHFELRKEEYLIASRIKWPTDDNQLISCSESFLGQRSFFQVLGVDPLDDVCACSASNNCCLLLLGRKNFMREEVVNGGHQTVLVADDIYVESPGRFLDAWAKEYPLDYGFV
ncbi:hypothetical protein L195_g045883, partial [Trifolium pratense]